MSVLAHRSVRAMFDAVALTLIVLAAALLVVPPLRASPPRLERQGRSVVLTELPPLLDDEEVRSQLESGLTTTFVVRLTVRDRQGHTAKGEGWIATRYELWDEVFLVGTGGLLGAGRSQLEDFDALSAWWRKPSGARVGVPSLRREDRWVVRIEIDVIPFSRDEQRDAQRWLADSLAAPEAGATESIASSTNEGGDPFGNVLNLLLATSIRRDALLSRRYTVELSPVADAPREDAGSDPPGAAEPREKHEP